MRKILKDITWLDVFVIILCLDFSFLIFHLAPISTLFLPLRVAFAIILFLGLSVVYLLSPQILDIICRGIDAILGK